MTARRGFTLFELMVVLALLAITAAAAVPALTNAGHSAPEVIAARAVAEAMLRARGEARASGRSVTFVLSPRDGRYWITSDSTVSGAIPLESLRIEAPSADRLACRFSAPGPATPCVVRVHGSDMATVRIDQWSGEVRVE